MQTVINNGCLENTVYNNYTAISKANEIRLLFGSSVLSNKTLVIIEGKTDKIYKFLLDENNVHIINNNTCDGLISLINILNKDYGDSIIVIKDADFDNLNHITYDEFDNIFLTDTHDVETMMLSTDEIEQKLSVEFMTGNERGFIQNCIKQLEALSYIKWYNILNHLNLVTRNVKIGNVYDGKNTVSLDDCETEIFKIEKNKQRCPNLVKEVQKFISTHYTKDIWNLVNGHDLCIALNIFFKKTGKSCGDISQCIRLGYTMKDFIQTNLYKKLTAWERIHKKNIINYNYV